MQFRVSFKLEQWDSFALQFFNIIEAKIHKELGVGKDYKRSKNQNILKLWFSSKNILAANYWIVEHI